MRGIITITLIVLSTLSYSQEYQKELIALDTIVGKNINSIERRDYYLFAFIDTLNYNYSQVFQLNDSTFQLNVYYLDSTVFDTIVNQLVINENKQNINLMRGYYAEISNEKEDVLNENIVKVVDLFEPPIIYNAKLYVENAKHNKKFRIKKNKYFHFKTKKKAKNSLDINTMGYDEKYRGFIYARVEDINFNDNLILLSRKGLGIEEEFFVSFDEIVAIKQNTIRTVFLKSLGRIRGIVIINPLTPIYFLPACLYNFVFKMRKCEMMNGDMLIVRSKSNNT